jgi:hypothetical protein
MATKARLETVLTGDATPFVAAVERAEKRAQTFDSRFKSLFRRSPDRRAEQALSGFVADLSSGNVQGALTGIATRISGVGLAAGVGIGAAAELFLKAKEQIDAVDESVKKVNADLARPLALQSALGPEGIGKEIEAAMKDMDDLAKKRSGFVQRFAEAWQRGQRSSFEMFSDTSGAADRQPAAAKTQQTIMERLRELSSARADAEIDLVQARMRGLKVSEEEGEIEKINLDYQKKSAALFLERGLTKPGRSAVDLLKSSLALQADRDLSIEAARQKAEMSKRSLNFEQELANMKLRGAPAEQQKVAQLKSELALIQAQLNFDKQLTIEEAAQLRIREIQAKVALRSEGMKEFFKTPAQRNQERIEQNIQRAREKQFDEAGGMLDVHRDMSGRIISGIDPTTGERISTPQPSELDRVLPDISPTHMTPFGGSEDFNKWFHPQGQSPAGSGQSDQADTSTVLSEIASGIAQFNNKMDQYWGNIAAG